MSIDWKRALPLAALALAACGGREQVEPAVLYAADTAYGAANGAIGTFPVLAPPPGPLTGRVISGLPALGYSIAYDAATDRLLAASAGAVVVFDGASKAQGSVLPSRTLTPSTALAWPYGLALDKARDTVYLLGGTPSTSLVLALRSAGTASGVRTPAFAVDVGRAHTLALDASRSIFYVGYLGTVTAVAFDPDTGAVLSHRTMAATGTGVSVDPARDRLYVADATGGVTVLSGASSGGGTLQAVVAIASAQFVTVDPGADRLYVGAYDRAYVLEQASQLVPGTIPSARAVQVAGSSIAGFAFP